MTTSQSSSARQARQALGARLRELRKDANLTGRALADRCGWHYTKVSKLENAAQSPTDDDLRHWCRATGTDDQTEDLIATARAVQSAYLEFRQQSRAGMKRVLGAHTLELYERTRKFRIYEHNVIPGLFQTPDYCAAMLSFWIAFLGTTNDLTDAVPARLERQRVIYQNGRQLAVILEEQALRTWFGTADTQARQLDHLLTVMTLPTVALGIIPMMTERTAVGSTGFWIFDNTLVALETPTASIEVTRPQEIELYTRMFERLRTSAVYGHAARALIHQAKDDLDRRRSPSNITQHS